MSLVQIAGVAGIAIGLACFRWADRFADPEAREQRRKAAAADRRPGRVAMRGLGWGAEDDRGSGETRVVYYRTLGLLVAAIGVAALLGQFDG